MKCIRCIFVPALLLSALCLAIPKGSNLESLGEFNPLSQNQTLYFTAEEIDLDGYGNAFLLDTAPVNSQVPEEADHAEFVSLPLAANFTFANLTVVVYHTLISEDGHQLDIKVGWLDAQNQPHISHFSYESLEIETQVTMHSFAVDCCGIVVFEGERLWVELQTSSTDIHLFWGTLTHDSRVSYHGAATFIPELPSFAISLVLIFLTLIAVVARARFKQT